jgi:hypothetical protein
VAVARKTCDADQREQRGDPGAAVGDAAREREHEQRREQRGDRAGQPRDAF